MTFIVDILLALLLLLIIYNDLIIPNIIAIIATYIFVFSILILSVLQVQICGKHVMYLVFNQLFIHLLNNNILDDLMAVSMD